MSTPSRARRAGQRAGLSRGSVLEAARRIAEIEGLEHLTMRRLSDELGVMPNAIYSYYPDKEALLDALLDALLAEIPMPDPDSVDWRDGLTELMDSSRRLLLAHPALVSMFLSRAAVGPNATRLGEVTFRLLRKSGLEGARAVEAFRALLIYSLGFAAIQAPRAESDSLRAQRAREVFGTLRDDEFPEMRRVAKHLATRPSDENFRAGLRWLLDGISS
jgi:TetR/AcrR family tetracycline transcriptional repressor